MRDHWFLMLWIAVIKVSPILSSFEIFRQPWFTAQRAALEAAPVTPTHKLQQDVLSLMPHLPAHFMSLSSHPDVPMHF